MTDDPLAFMKDHIRRYRASNGADGYDFNGVKVLLLDTVGARSGEPRTAALLYARHGEAFAVVAMAPIRELGIPHAKVNVNGGACALGHPIGASGARLVVTLVNALRARGLRKGVAALCIGGGEATAVAVEVV